MASPVKLSRRVNARLQLAAALIEADNEVLTEQAALQRERELYSRRTGNAGDEGIDAVAIGSVPPLKLASESAIFSPFRRGAKPLPHQRSRSNSLASRLSQLDAAHSDMVEGGRPSIDFLGVAMPSERAHSRAGSIASLSRASFDSGDVFGTTAPATLEEPVLDGWNVDKFLSREERGKVEGRRSRANSIIGLVHSQSTDSILADDANAAKHDDQASRARSEVNTTATGTGILSQLSRGRSNRGLRAAPDSALLAKIKLYRERQESLPPSEWQGPGPLGSSSAVQDHIDAATDDERVALQTVTAHKQSASESSIADLNRHKSSAGVTGTWTEPWSEQEGDVAGGRLEDASSAADPSVPPMPTPLGQSRRNSSSILLAPQTAVPGDPFGVFQQDSTRYPSHLVSGENDGEDDDDDDDRPLELLGQRKRQSVPMDTLTTKQLQRLARKSQLPEFYGEFDARSSMETTRTAAHDSIAPPRSKRKPLIAVQAPKLLKRQAEASGTPDLSSASWRSKGQRLKLGGLFTAKEERTTEQPQSTDSDLNEDWRTNGPLQARGLEARMPSTLVMPPPLQETQPRTQNAGIHVPPGFVLHDGRGLPPMRLLPVAAAASAPGATTGKSSKKADALLNEFLSSTLAERPVPVPATAPSGIGRRAASYSTALFRNQLVQHDEEKEGWGWERHSDSGALGAEDLPAGADAVSEKQTRMSGQRDRTESRKRRKERQARHQFFGTDYGAVGAGSDEDESGSGTDSSSLSFGSDERPWQDNARPAGKLYGKSLLDLAQDKATIRKNAGRFYGQHGLQTDATADTADVADRTPAFADRPVGLNDTRERMQAVFGKDEIWERDMEKRRQEDQVETQPQMEQSAEILQPEPAVAPPILDVQVAPLPGHDQTAEWFAGASDHDSDSDTSAAHERPRSGHYEGRKSFTLEHATQQAAGIAVADAGSDTDGSEDLPLDQLQLRRRSTQGPLPALSVAGIGDDTSDEEMPLSQILKKKKDFVGDILHLGSANTEAEDAVRMRTASPLESGESSDDDDAPLGVVHPQASEALRRLHADLDHHAEDSDDEPLGVAHPQAAIIAEQAAIIKQLQAERALSQAPSPWSMPAYPPPMSVYGMPGAPAFGPGLVPFAAPPGSDIGLSAQPYDPKSGLINRWRSEVPGDAGASSSKS